MEFEPTTLPEVVLIKPRVFRDARGYFLETWHQPKFAAAGINLAFLQDNHSHSVRHTLRGLHFQIQQAQGKLVRVARGEAFDVAVDIRRSSPRFGQWVGVTLSDANHYMLWVPPGFAHGFLVLSDGAEITYKCTTYYAPEHDRSLLWSDPSVGIQWPVGDAPLLAAKDRDAATLDRAEVFA